jgi:hypothetical protein
MWRKPPVTVKMEAKRNKLYAECTRKLHATD